MNVHDSNLRGAGLHLAEGPLAGPAKTQAARAERASSQASAAAGDGRDGIELSGLARQLQALAAESPERAARVESLARLYAEGNYRVDPESTAAAIIDDALGNP
jgi:flagellar biosynthesis anti-sigma factor FlgM